MKKTHMNYFFFQTRDCTDAPSNILFFFKKKANPTNVARDAVRTVCVQCRFSSTSRADTDDEAEQRRRERETFLHSALTTQPHLVS